MYFENIEDPYQLTSDDADQNPHCYSCRIGCQYKECLLYVPVNNFQSCQDVCWVEPENKGS